MNRFFVQEKVNEHFILSPETLKHLKVIRAENKQFICIYQDEFYLCQLENQKAKIIEKILNNHENPFEIVLAISIIKLERFEWMLQKATELGVSTIIPMDTTFCNTDLIKYKFDKKLERFKTILQNAAEQSFRNKIPTLAPIHTFDQALNYPINHKYLAHEKINISQRLNSQIDHACMFFIGPEGGFSDQEIEQAKTKNVEIISLGSRILRAETAALYLLSQVKMY
ncbi:MULTISPECIES: 16S rRNA (uracil(1498)-N(3))-methyltransferase [unclassified Mycoplasma]|uniref:16S rRNA (uracil(1498)-N(3))-methyltransferase n=1 Tax=unclassified Mycoplasma TaxID=2683645 RepID=UPI00211B8CE8|nr:MULTISPECIES: 16S rRNA (uracil(1498)-N(3))-methyltransferase [unclassified Mycoplasma]UUM19507.1 16S rRNA (uracil(1498)-N(3))-methyltransferase [Mycoplasma sp. 1578d]UUM25130.1 16S rRNA (uracil(1498)-N(3))-methyltransferase [Mycoplasma sp. 3686d]